MGKCLYKYTASHSEKEEKMMGFLEYLENYIDLDLVDIDLSEDIDKEELV
jgi:hypothetical protein